MRGPQKKTHLLKKKKCVEQNTHSEICGCSIQTNNDMFSISYDFDMTVKNRLKPAARPHSCIILVRKTDAVLDSGGHVKQLKHRTQSVFNTVYAALITLDLL